MIEEGRSGATEVAGRATASRPQVARAPAPRWTQQATGPAARLEYLLLPGGRPSRLALGWIGAVVLVVFGASFALARGDGPRQAAGPAPASTPVTATDGATAEGAAAGAATRLSTVGVLPALRPEQRRRWPAARPRPRAPAVRS